MIVLGCSLLGPWQVNRKVIVLYIIEFITTVVGTQHKRVKGFLDKCLQKAVSC